MIKRKEGIIPVLEGLVILIMIHALGGYYLFPLLYRIYHDVPIIFLRIISSSAISSLIASSYMIVRFKMLPRVSLNKSIFKVATSGVILSWIIIFVELLFLERNNPFIQEILQLRLKYLYLVLFLVIVWGPIFEELLFRGIFFEILTKKYSKTVSVIIVSILFVGFHILWKKELNLCTELALFLDSVIFTIVYMEGGLIASMITHSFVNFYLIFLNI